ncbi:MAG: hypothetical protein ACXAC0_02390 [Candidatus Thorarchaeota archaeon]
MHVPTKKRLLIIGLFLVLFCFAFVTPESEFLLQTELSDPEDTTTSPETDLSPLEEVVIEGEPVFIRSEVGDDYVDSTYTITHGTLVNGPPVGMGSSSTTSTDITEEYYSTTSWTNLMTQSTFTALPSGWTDSLMTYSGGDFHADPLSPGGYIYCSPVSTSSYDDVRFTVYCRWNRISGSGGVVYVEFYDSSSNWDVVGTVPMNSVQNQVFSSADSQYQHANFRVRVRYSGFGELTHFLNGNNWIIDGGSIDTGHRFDMVWRFTDVDYNTFYSEELVVDFDGTSSTDYLDYWFEAGDSTPDSSVYSHQSGGFTANIHDKLTGSTCYLRISDEHKSGDGDQDTWKIDRLFIRLTNAIPVNDQAPSCTNLDDTDYLYARYKIYEFSTSFYDADGYSHIDIVELRSYDSLGLSLRWTVRYNETSNEWTIPAGSSYITLATPSVVKSGSNLDITIQLYIEWDHPDTTDDSLRQFVIDESGNFDQDDYLVQYNYETRLDLEDDSFGDLHGTAMRGPVNGQIWGFAYVIYLGSASSLHPPSSEVDVWTSATLNSGAGPWSDTTLSGGQFSMNVTADNVTGYDTYSFKVVLEGEGFSGIDQLHHSVANGYISDQIEVQSLISNDGRISINEPSTCSVQLSYEYDGFQVTDGTVTVNGVSATYSGSGGVWIFSETKDSVQSVTYDSVETDGDTHGITAVNMNLHSLEQIWDSVTVSISDPIDQRISLDDNATGIVVTGVYDFDGQPFDGTFSLNDTTFSYSSVGRRGYTVLSISGDSFGITTISANDATYCIWDAIELLSLESPEWVLVGNSFNVVCEARLMYDGHVLGVDDAITIDNEVATWNGSHFVISRVYHTIGDRTFNITSALENSFGINGLGNYLETLTHVTAPTTPTTSSSTEPTTSPTAPPLGSPLAILIGLGIGGIAIVVVTIIIIRKKR